ncbi:MAG: hypothetical protein HQ510_05335 [Candidatus Marinimicrobia bacterium]|nr:hypothetical protein [Candidatus Neomarinimicrobiota bacterium]
MNKIILLSILILFNIQSIWAEPHFLQNEENAINGKYKDKMAAMPDGIYFTPALVSAEGDNYFSPSLGLVTNDGDSPFFSIISINYMQIRRADVITPSITVANQISSGISLYLNCSNSFLIYQEDVYTAISATIGFITHQLIEDEIGLSFQLGYGIGISGDIKSSAFSFGGGITLPVAKSVSMQPSLEIAVNPDENSNSFGVGISFIFKVDDY